MPHSFLRASACLTILLLLAGCDVGRTDEPLPTVAELRDEFETPEPGRGVIVDGRTRYETDAEHHTSFEVGPAATIATFRVNLVSDPRGAALTILKINLDGDTLQTGDEFLTGFSYSGTSDGSRGSGIFGITSVDGDRIAGVFAADLTPNGLVPQFPRIRGAFHATRRAE